MIAPSTVGHAFATACTLKALAQHVTYHPVPDIA
jgi:hypothetical protein